MMAKFLPNTTMFSTATSSSLVESEDDLLDGELRKSISSSIYAALCQGDSCKEEVQF